MSVQKSKAKQIRELVEGRSRPDAQKIASDLKCPEAYVRHIIERCRGKK